MKKLFILLLILLTTSASAKDYSGGYGKVFSDSTGTIAKYLYDQNHAIADNEYIGLGAAAGRFEFDDQALDEINFLDCTIGIGTSTPDVLAGFSQEVLSGLDYSFISKGASSRYNIFNLDAYSSTDGEYPIFDMRHSQSNTVGTIAESTDLSVHGAIRFWGVDSVPSWTTAASITAKQDGAAGGVYVPTNLKFSTASSSAFNTDLFVLHNEGYIEQGGARILTPTGDQSIVAGTGITAAMFKGIVRIYGTGGVDISANPQIAAGVDGMIITLQGTSDVNYVLIEDGNGLALSGGVPFQMGNLDNITLEYDAGETVWLQVGGRADH